MFLTLIYLKDVFIMLIWCWFALISLTVDEFHNKVKYIYTYIEIICIFRQKTQGSSRKLVSIDTTSNVRKNLYYKILLYIDSELSNT